jgi:hypothetical protein
MTWTFAKFAAAGVLTAIPFAAVGIPAYASETSGGAPIVLQAPLPADPPPPPAPPAPPTHHGEYYSPNDYNDWYNAGADGGGGGGGGG